MVVFEPVHHQYLSINQNDADIIWTSVTTLLKLVKEEFDTVGVSERVSKKPKSKWYGISPKEIRQIWKDEAARANLLGNWYHDQREADILECDTLNRYGKDIPIIMPMTDDKDRKVAQSQQLIEGVYPELLVYLKSAAVCGQSDLVEVCDGLVHITDYKTNKKIEERSYKNWEGVRKMLLHPLSHLEDCNLVHYQLQLSIYMYIILRHNPRLKPGKIMIHHVSFEEDGQNEYGYPIHKTTEDGNYIIKELKPIELPYLKDDVVTLMNYHKSKI